MKKIKVAVLFGGCSEEHDISVKSAGQIAASLNTEKYEVYYIGITKSGEWKRCEKPVAGWEKQAGPTIILSPDRGWQQGLLQIEGSSCNRIQVDVIFPVMHGKMGEDGMIQGLFELSGIPFVGCDIESSVLGMDKALAYMVAEKAGIAVPGFYICDAKEKVAAETFSYPVFVKPARSGSSFGVKKVTAASELSNAIEEAAIYDGKVLIEEAIDGCEVGCAVLGNGENLSTGEVDQIEVKNGFFRIHQEKQPEMGSENATITVPAAISKEKSNEVKATAKQIYRALGCKGLARVDMFLKPDGTVVLNEVNTLPGCTVYSRYPRMMQAAGISMEELADRLITLALERFKK